MINPQKSIVIFSYPRSGSTWFQNKLRHFNLQEMMNYNVKFKFTRDSLAFDRAYWIDHPPHDDIIKYRIDMLKFYHRNYSPVSLKVQTRYLRPMIIDALRELDFQYVALKRRDKYSTLLSFLIVSYTDQWGGLTTPHTISIDRATFDGVVHVLKNFENELAALQKIFSIETLYFEDTLDWPTTDWWKQDCSITVQNAKSMTTILNQDQLDEWIEESGYLTC